MSWNSHQRRPQQSVDCPDSYRGDRRRYVEQGTRSEPNPPVLAGLMPIGRRWRGKPISAVPTGYLEWVLRDVRGRGNPTIPRSRNDDTVRPPSAAQTALGRKNRSALVHELCGSSALRVPVR